MPSIAKKNLKNSVSLCAQFLCVTKVCSCVVFCIVCFVLLHVVGRQARKQIAIVFNQGAKQQKPHQTKQGGGKKMFFFLPRRKVYVSVPVCIHKDDKASVERRKKI